MHAKLRTKLMGSLPATIRVVFGIHHISNASSDSFSFTKGLPGIDEVEVETAYPSRKSRLRGTGVGKTDIGQPGSWYLPTQMVSIGILRRAS